jgi:hypothetical protein
MGLRLAPGYSSLNPTNLTTQEPNMNIAKNMEVIFITALALVSVTTLANAAVPAHRAAAPLIQQVDASVPMAVVTITAKRLTAAQKAQLGN